MKEYLKIAVVALVVVVICAQIDSARIKAGKSKWFSA